MNCNRFHFAAFALALAATAGTFTAANALARQQYVVAERVVLAGTTAATPQTVLVIGHRAAET